MRNQLILLMGLLLAGHCFAEKLATDDKNVGWQFYNLPKEPKEKPKPTKEPEKSPIAPSATVPKSAVDKLKFLQAQLEEAKANAVLNPTVENIAKYKVYQDYFVNKSTEFASKWEQMLLAFPNLDYNIQNSFYNNTVPIKAAQERAEQNKAVQAINQNYGVFFFYRGNEPLDRKLAEVIKAFSEQYGLSIVPVSVDGVMSPEYPQSRVDQGQTAKMGVKYFPALFIVNPKKKEYKPLAYGFITQDDLARRVLNVVTNFKPRI